MKKVLIALVCIIGIIVLSTCTQNTDNPVSANGSKSFEIQSARGIDQDSALTGFKITGIGFDNSMIALLDSIPLTVIFTSATELSAFITDSIDEGSHMLTLKKGTESAYIIVHIIKGAPGTGIIWKGTLATAPTSPKYNWAYYDSLKHASYIYDGMDWTVLIMSIPGIDGISIVWKGTLTAAPVIPQANWAYYNSLNNVSYIYNGASWDTLAVGVTGIKGDNGLNGLNIIWKGSLNIAPTSPDTNWAYYNINKNISYLWSGLQWDTLVLGVTGKNGISIIWKGNDTIPPASPDTNWAYYNSKSNISFIYSGSKWDTLAVGVMGLSGINGANGINGLSIIWMGSYALAPTTPDTNWAYYNINSNISFIWSGLKWDTLIVGITGKNGISIIWKGNDTIAPVSPDTNWAYYNSKSNVSFIYTGFKWDTLAVGVIGNKGDKGLSGISIIWKGSSIAAPSTPDTNWAYFNISSNISFIWNGVKWDTLIVGVTGKDGISIIWKGNDTIPPASPDTNWAYYNSKSNISFIYTGSKWDTLAVGVIGNKGDKGLSGISIIWKGSSITAPSSPDSNWAYYNTNSNISFIWNGSAWDTLIVGVTGKNGISLVWKGSLTVAPLTPDTNWAYYNTVSNISFIYNGVAWDTLAVGVTGAPGTNGMSIIWKGSLVLPPASPSMNWAYYNTALNTSYIWDGDSWEILLSIGLDILSGDITLIAPSLTNNTKPTISWTAYAHAWGYRYRWLMDTAWTAVDSSKHSYTPLLNIPEGQNIFVIQAWIAASTFSSAKMCTVVVDITPPIAPVVSGVDSTGNKRPVWTWNVPTSTTGFKYQLDGSSWTVVNNTVTSFTPASDLNAGNHTLYVQACDESGNWTATAQHQIFINLSTTTTPVVATPYPTVQTRRPTWTWNVPTSATGFRYQLDGTVEGQWTTVGVGVTTFTPSSDIDTGSHSLYVQAVNSLGNWSLSGTAITRIVIGLYGDTLYVSTSTGNDVNDGTKNNPKKTVSAAISTAAANNAHTVLIAQGNYVEDITLTDGISLYGGYSTDFSSRNMNPAGTIINSNTGSRIVDGNNRNVVVCITSTQTVKLQALTLSPSISLSNTYGIYIQTIAEINVDSCIIYAGAGTQAIGVNMGVNPTNLKINKTKISAHGANNSYGIFSSGNLGVISMNNTIVDSVYAGILLYYSDSVYMRNCTFKNISERAVALAGGYEIVLCSLYSIGSNAIDGNYFKARGIVDSCYIADASMPLYLTGSNIQNSIILNSSSRSELWACNVNGCTFSNSTLRTYETSLIERCNIIIAPNHTGIEAVQQTRVINCLFDAGANTSAISLNNSSYSINNTILGQSGAIGLFLSPDVNAAKIVNNIITGCAVGIQENNVNDPLEVRNNLIYNCPVLYHDNDNNVDLTTQADLNDYTKTTQHVLRYSDGNVVADPLFVGVNDYRLQVGSPAVNTGRDASSADYGNVIDDYLGVTRPQGAGYDIGAYESH